MQLLSASRRDGGYWTTQRGVLCKQKERPSQSIIITIPEVFNTEQGQRPCHGKFQNSMGEGDERVPLSATDWLHEWRKSEIQEWRQPFLPQVESLASTAGCQTVSVARDIYSETVQTAFEIKVLQPLLREKEKHVQRWVIGTESKLMVRDQTVWWQERFDIGSNDWFLVLVCNWKQVHWLIVDRVCFCTLLGDRSDVCWLADRGEVTKRKGQTE